MAAQEGLPAAPDDTYRPFVVGDLPYSSRAVNGQTVMERDAASVLLSIAQTRPTDISPDDWQDSVLSKASELIRNESTDELDALLKLQMLIQGRVADLEKHRQTEEKDQQSLEGEIKVIAEQAKGNEANLACKSLRSGTQIADQEKADDAAPTANGDAMEL